MADPLRRTLSKLRSRRAQRGAAGCCSAEAARARPTPDGTAGPGKAPQREESMGAPTSRGGADGGSCDGPGSPLDCRGGSSRVPALGGEAAPMLLLIQPPRPEEAPCCPPLPLRDAEEDDAEDADYYDNERLLPGWGCPGAGARGSLAPTLPGRQQQRSLDGATRRESNGRLRRQLQEAYYLLIHAMHDLPPAAASPLLGGRHHHPTPGPEPRRLPSSQLGRPPGQRRAACRRHGISRSLDSLPDGYLAEPQPLHRRSRSWSWSDRDPHQARRRPAASRGHLPRQPPPSPVAGPLLLLPPTVAPRPCAPAGEEVAVAAAAPPTCGESGPRFRPRPRPEGREEAPCKPGPTVTVRKLQKWMYKGRLLSLSLKSRGGAAPAKAPGPGPAGSGLPPALLLDGEEGPATRPGGPLRAQGSEVLVAPSDQSLLLTDLIENVYIPSVSRRKLDNFKSSEAAECRPWIASITVSKKRNWLHQSSPRVPNLEKGSVYKTAGETCQVLKSATPLLELKMPPIFSKHVGCESPPGRVRSVRADENGMSPLAPRNCTLDFVDDFVNDADDEGEIWYNPIPEDEEPEFPCLVGNNADSYATKMSSGHDQFRVAGYNESLPHTSDYVGRAAHRELHLVNGVHSMERLQVCRPQPVCSPLTGLAMEENSTLKGTSGGPGISGTSKGETGLVEYSPPSPNPLKKGASINWSFPDKIKSPRTVRKLSIKMKRLPELSRKLSAKGNSSHNNSVDNSASLRNNCQNMDHVSLPVSGNMTAAASRNVISRYHLDSSVSSQHNYKKKSNRGSKSSSKGGYLSDGDSPELITKSGMHGTDSRAGKGREAFANSSSSSSKSDIDIDAFRHYSFSEQPKCSQYISGLMSIHFYGAEDLKPPRIDSKDVFCAIQVDSVNKARTALLTCRTTFLDLDHTFNIEIENAQHLKLVVFSWEPMPRKNRVCCHGTVVLPALFRVTKTHQLAVKLEPRGLIYVKLTLLEQWENSLNGLDGEREPVVFGVDARKVVAKENVGLMVPLLMKKCITEIEKRGCQVVGLYRLCGSAAVKKELREAFEKDSKAVTLCESQYPDINVITGILKDYLRELPSPLITKELYEAVLETMIKAPLKTIGNGDENAPSDAEQTVALLNCLPEVEKATLRMLLDHLKLVASYHEVNRMTCQNLAVCFGPVLLSQRQETIDHHNRVFTDSEELASALDLKKHIEVLRYLLQLWPAQYSAAKESAEQQSMANYLRPKKQRPQVLNLSRTDASGILRSRPARLDSPSSNRYAGDWTGCGENYVINLKEALNEADYDDVPLEDAESKAGGPEKRAELATSIAKEHTFQAYLAMQTMDSAVNHRANLKDLQESIDTLIGNLEQELNKNKFNIHY